MADPYIDQYETQSYGPFAAVQVRSLVLGLDTHYDPLLEHLLTTLSERTATLGEIIARVEKHVVVTYRSEADDGAVPGAIDTMRKLVSYAQSRDDGDTLVADILGRASLSTLGRLRPARIPGVLDAALKAVDKHRDALPEHAQWTRRLRAAHKAVTDLNTRVRTSRSVRREMTPEMASAREAWLGAYAALKLAVESALRLHDKTHLMPEVFDDLAETHRAANVSDGDAPVEQPSTPR